MTTTSTERLDPAVVARVRGLGLRYRSAEALDGVDVDIPAGGIVGIIGPDGVGKSSLLALIAGARTIQTGTVETLGGDMADPRHRRAVFPRIAYMPQGLGRNLYPTLTVAENIDFFARLFGQARAARARRIADLTAATGLAAFVDRPAGKLSGGMKQKLGLCCALIHDPDLLILDEPTTGVDPLSRRRFWELIERIRGDRPGMSILVATAYMEEAARFDHLLAMNTGRLLTAEPPQRLLERTGAETLEGAFISLLPEAQRERHEPVIIPPRSAADDGQIAIEAEHLTLRFGTFTAVDDVSFRIRRGEIFGFVGSNGCGKTTTMKMLTGLLPPSEGQARLFGRPVDPRDLDTRRRVGYMSQSFSLYGELTVAQNLILHARLFEVPAADFAARVEEVAARFGLEDRLEALPAALPLGHRQRLSLAVATIHRPELLILDEPTSGVDPIARDGFWRMLAELSRRDGVTIFISTHYMHEAERCDRVALMHEGRVLATDAPAALIQQRGAANLDDAFVDYLRGSAAATSDSEAQPPADGAVSPDSDPHPAGTADAMPAKASLQRLRSYAHREALELRRDPIRLTLAMLGSVILMLVMGYGMSMDVEDLTFAVLDRDQTTLSRSYALDLAGSRYFIELSPLVSYADLDRRMRRGDLSLAIEIPPGFARDAARGRPVEIGAWVDGAMPSRAETALSYVQGIHGHWLATLARAQGQPEALAAPAELEVRFRYNPDLESLSAMVPAMIPILLMMIPAMLASLSVVREKEVGSIINFYVTPTRRLEFLLGKQIPYVVLAAFSFLLLVLIAVLLLGIPFKGSFMALAAGGLLYVAAATALGLLISTFMHSQLAAIFGTTILTILPAVSFSGLIDPVSSLDGFGRAIGEIYPTTHFLTIARGTFSKGLGFADLWRQFLALALAIPLLLVLSAALLRKQER